MLLDLAIVRAEIVHNIFGDKSFTALLFSCTNGGSCTVEIGGKYAFSRGSEQGLEHCGLKLRVAPRSSLTDENIAVQGLNQEIIGRLAIYSSEILSSDEILSPALLEASVFLDDQVFNKLLNSLEMQRGISSALLSISGRMLMFQLPDLYTWRIDNAQEPSYLHITRLEIIFLLFEREGTS
jgi:hypothetical protein